MAEYLTLLESIFDFALIKSFLKSTPDYKVLFDGLHGVTGPYARAIFVDTLGLAESSIQNCVPKPDFGGSHPDPNLVYAHSLVEVVEKNNIPFGAASDGDGDRNMIYGKGAFVTPSDSVAIIADWAGVIPYFKKNGVKGLARSMPTSGAIDLVAQKKGIEVFEVPTGRDPRPTRHSNILTCVQDGSSLVTLWTPAAFLSAAKNRSVPVRTTFAKRTVSGRSSVCVSLGRMRCAN